MADRGDADFPQILGRQASQQIGVDVVFAECLLVLFEPEPPQPARDIHACLPDRAPASGATENYTLEICIG